VTRKKDNVVNKVTNVISVTLRIPRAPLIRVRNISGLYVITKKAQIMPLLVSYLIWLKDMISGHTSFSTLNPCFVRTKITQIPAHLMEMEYQLQSPRPFMCRNGYQIWKLLKRMCVLKFLLLIFFIFFQITLFFLGL
jgi:hypothetical protein